MKLILILLLIPSVLFGDTAGGTYGRGVASSGGPDAAIVFYFNCNANTNDQAPQKGSGTISYTSDFSVVAGSVSNALSSAGTSSGYEWNIPTSSNLNFAVGTLGFYWSATTLNTNLTILRTTVDSAPRFFLFTPDSTHLEWEYKDGNQSFSISTATTYFIELSWDGTLNKQSYRIDGGSWVEATGLSGSNPSGSDLAIGSLGGGVNVFWIDQIMVANTYQKDLYSVRTSTNP